MDVDIFAISVGMCVKCHLSNRLHPVVFIAFTEYAAGTSHVFGGGNPRSTEICHPCARELVARLLQD